MSIVKTYLIQVTHHDQSISHVRRKAISRRAIETVIEQEFSEECYASVLGLARVEARKDKKGFLAKEPVFGRWSRKIGARLTYRHKGRRKKGRRNYPPIAKRWVSSPITFTWTETYSPEMSAAMQEWTKGLTAPANGPLVANIDEVFPYPTNGMALGIEPVRKGS